MNPATTTARSCPLCGGTNECRVANGSLYKGPCWCESAQIPVAVLRHLAASQLESACLCWRCLAAVASHATKHEEPEKVIALVRAEVAAKDAEGDQDFYLDELGRTVFTAAYHLKRGNCCGSGCRHCPYPNGELSGQIKQS